MLRPKWNKCTNMHGDYVEKLYFCRINEIWWWWWWWWGGTQRLPEFSHIKMPCFLLNKRQGQNLHYLYSKS
jgi:hypothetical protein